jgi:hypothetical protein
MNVLRIVLIAALVLFESQAIFACPVCYGASDSPMADGVNAAILALLGVTGGVLSLFGAFFLYLRKRSRKTLNGTFDYQNLNS